MNRLQPAIDLAGHVDGALAEAELIGEGALRPAEQRRQHLARLVRIVVDRLLAEDDELRALLLDDLLEDLGDREGLDRLVGLDEDAAVGAHGKRGAERLLGLLRADRDGHDLGRLALLLQADRLFNSDLVEGVHGHLDVGELDSDPSGFTRILTFESTTRFTGTRIFMGRRP